MATWHEVYTGDLQGLYALGVVPTLFLVYLLAGPRPRPSLVAPGATRLMRSYALLFAAESVLDPLVGGPILRWLGLADGRLATAAMVLFVLLGDLRVLLLVFFLTAVGRRRSSGRPADVGLAAVVARAAAWTLIVPVAAAVTHGALRLAAGEVPGQTLWLLYELAFVVLAGVLGLRVVPAEVPAGRPELRAYLRDVIAYVALYYALWAVADVLILTGHDVGWALRMLPNQLYYGFYLPVVYGLFLSDRYAATSNATHASR